MNKPIIPVLPDWVPAEAWAEFIKMRKQMKKPMTAYAEKLMLKRLRAFSDDGQDVEAMLNQSIINCWQSVYAVKEEPMQQAPRTPFQQRPPQLSLVDQNRSNSEAARKLLFGSRQDDDLDEVCNA